MNTIRMIAVLCSLLSGCVAPVGEDEPSDSSLVEGATEGSSRSRALALMMRSGALVESDLLRGDRSAELGFDIAPMLRDAHDGPGAAARAVRELYRLLIDQSGFSDGAAAFNQFLSQDPASASGAIASVGNGCASFDGFFLQSAIAEPDPPLARLIVTHDSSAGADCHIDGTVQYDLRLVPTAGGRSLRVVMSYPDGLTIQPETGEPFFVAAGGSIFVGLAFDSSDALSALEAGADYCVRRGAMGTEACFEDVQLAVTGAVTATIVDGTCATCASRYGDAFVDGLAGDQVQLTIGTGLDAAMTGTVRYGSDSLTLGGAMPLVFAAGFDSTEGVSAVLDGEASTTIDGNDVSYAFTALGATAPLDRITFTLDGCAARTAAQTTTVCFDGLDLGAEAGSEAGSIRLTAAGALTYTAATEATYTFTATSAEVRGTTVTLGGSVTRSTSGGSITVVFEGFAVSAAPPVYAVSGVVELVDGMAQLVRADFCAGSTFTRDAAAETVTLRGCVTLESALGTVELGTEASAMTVVVVPGSSTIDGPLTYDNPADMRIMSVTFVGWRAENLEESPLDAGYHRRITGRALVDVLGFSGSVESTSGIEARVTGAGEGHTVELDGDVAVAIDTGGNTVTGTLDFAGYSANVVGDTIGHLGVIDMDVMFEHSNLSGSMRVTFGDGATPLTTALDGTITTIDGRVLFGIGCASGTCNENITILLTGLAFDSPPCGRQHPHTGRAVISGLVPTTSALIPALHVRCECDGRAGRETLLPRRVTMDFTDATPTMARIQIPEANGVCGIRPNSRCNEPGAAWLREDSVCDP